MKSGSPALIQSSRRRQMVGRQSVLLQETHPGNTLDQDRLDQSSKSPGGWNTDDLRPTGVFLGEEVLAGEAILMLTSGFHRNKSGVPYAFLFQIKYNIIIMLIENTIYGTLMGPEQVWCAALRANQDGGHGWPRVGAEYSPAERLKAQSWHARMSHA
jgi:hypothetical protein